MNYLFRTWSDQKQDFTDPSKPFSSWEEAEQKAIAKGIPYIIEPEEVKLSNICVKTTQNIIRPKGFKRLEYDETSYLLL